MNGLTQSVTKQILALQLAPDKDKPKELAPIIELDVLRIVDSALAEASKPHLEEAENCKRLVNETNDRATARVQEAIEAASRLQNEVIGLRTERDEALTKVIEAGNKMGEQHAEIEELKKAKDALEEHVTASEAEFELERIAFKGALGFGVPSGVALPLVAENVLAKSIAEQRDAAEAEARKLNAVIAEFTSERVAPPQAG